MSYKEIFSYKDIVEKELERRVSEKNAPEILKKAMLYSLSAGGKRIRPCLMLEFYRCLGFEPKEILNFACAVEMIHTYSLIHDDLPCMDDDDMRRGKPSNHKVFGEDNALLAGDALLTLAFETACDIDKNIKPDRAVKAVKYIADAAGLTKMVGGQVLDLAAENKQVSIKELERIQEGKTVAMLKVNAYVACTLAGADEKTTKLYVEYCENIGRAFQIRDDILDVIGDEKNLGKPIGSDEQMNKNTYVSLLGLEKSQQLVDKLTESAILAIKSATDDNEDLCLLALKLANRDY
ncbi:MAG: polyprenyl synthetase family protein [Clostridia bacterium]|nr:polyprenyl synthetase family protein [Clostridia bacterium]